MKLESLSEFAELAGCRNFKRAAKKLFISQSSLSSHIASLERDLGFKLVDRDSTSFALTPAGSLFLSYAQDIVDTFEDAKEACMAVSRNRPPIRVSGPITDSELLDEFSSVDGFSVSYIDMPLHSTPLDLLATDKLDIGIMPDLSFDNAALEKAETLGVSWSPIRPGRLGIAVSRSSALGNRENLTRVDLHGATVSIGSPVWFNLGKRMYRSLLGENLNLKFVLAHVEGEADLSCAELGESIHICELSSIRKRYAFREDIVIFDSLDGSPLFQPRVLVYLKHPSRSHVGEYAGKVIAALSPLRP